MLNTSLSLASQAGLFLKQIAKAAELTRSVSTATSYESAALGSERRESHSHFNNGQEIIGKLKDEHEALYTQMISNRGEFKRSTSILNARTFIGQLSEAGRTVKILDHYTWLAIAVLQWQIAFSSVLEEPLKQEITEPRNDLIAPYPIPQHLMSHSLLISLWRRISKISSSAQEEVNDWYQSEVYFASEVLDCGINFADQVDERGFEYLQMVWFRDVIKVKAYFRWWDRVIKRKQQTEETIQDYFYACYYDRWRLLHGH